MLKLRISWTMFCKDVHKSKDMLYMKDRKIYEFFYDHISKVKGRGSLQFSTYKQGICVLVLKKYIHNVTI